MRRKLCPFAHVGLYRIDENRKINNVMMGIMEGNGNEENLTGSGPTSKIGVNKICTVEE